MEKPPTDGGAAGRSAAAHCASAVSTVPKEPVERGESPRARPTEECRCGAKDFVWRGGWMPFGMEVDGRGND
jgi:hypothetical protein